MNFIFRTSYRFKNIHQSGLIESFFIKVFTLLIKVFTLIINAMLKFLELFLFNVVILDYFIML